MSLVWRSPEPGRLVRIVLLGIAVIVVVACDDTPTPPSPATVTAELPLIASTVAPPATQPALTGRTRPPSATPTEAAPLVAEPAGTVNPPPACAVTRSQETTELSELARYHFGRNGYGNAEGTLFVELWPAGTVLFTVTANGPGEELPDGSLVTRLRWLRAPGIAGRLSITGHRLDAAAPPLQAHIPEGEVNQQASYITFPTEGCWEVTGRVGENELTFVALVVQVPFALARPTELPEGFIWHERDVRFDALPSVQLVYSSPDTPGELIVETTPAAQDSPQAIIPLTSVNGQPAACVPGLADSGALRWTAGGFHYRILYSGLALNCADLIRIAESLSFF